MTHGGAEHPGHPCPGPGIFRGQAAPDSGLFSWRLLVLTPAWLMMTMGSTGTRLTKTNDDGPNKD